jgi:hypothetical protein
MSARIIVSQTLIITAHVEVKDENLLHWLENETNLFDYLTPEREKNPEINVEVTSMDRGYDFDIQSIEKSDGSEWKWNGEQLAKA